MVTWHVDDRPASLRARGYVALMRLARDKQAFEGAERTRWTALDVIEVPSMFHVWMTRAIPEGRRTRGLLRNLVRRSATD